MSHDPSSQILASLSSVDSLRARRMADPGLDRRVQAIKRFQHARFHRTYADLLADPRQGAAAGFFLEELYGPRDFTSRDAQFARIVPALVRLFPSEIVQTVRALAELHALSEQLDSDMGSALDASDEVVLNLAEYRRAWCVTGQASERERQIVLMLEVGTALGRFTRSALLRRSLRMMRRPAGAAGLGALQQFLERGFETFGALARPDEFLRIIAKRERRIGEWLFSDEAGEAPLGLDGSDTQR